MSLVVKVCGMRDRVSTQRVAELRPDYLGFIFAPRSPRFITMDEAADLRAALPMDLPCIGVFVHEEVHRVKETVEACKLQGAQLHGDEDKEYIEELRSILPSHAIWKAISFSKPNVLKQIPRYDGLVDLFVFDSGSGGTGEAFDWNILHSYTGRTPYLLAGGIGLEEWWRLKEYGVDGFPGLKGIDVNSRFERVPGTKDVEAVQKLLSEVRNGI